MAPRADLDQTLIALADRTRRAILQRLLKGEARVTELARPFAMSLNSVSKHIRVLERAEIDGRVGGRFVVVHRRDGEGSGLVVEPLESVRPRRRVLSCAGPKFPAELPRATTETAPWGGGCEPPLTPEGVLPDYASRTQG